MDINLLSKIVKEIILDKDEVSLPGLGSFIAELVPSVFSDKGYTINPPYKRLYFRQKENPQDTSLIDFYASSNKIEKQIASDIVCDFLRELRKVLEVKKTIIFPGLGRLRATKENYFFFVADENLDIYPEGFGLEPISLKTHEETTSEVSNTMATLRAILSPEEDANEPAQVKVNADVIEGVAVENSHPSETAENVTVKTTKSTTDGVTTETVDPNTEVVTTNSATSDGTGKATAGTVNSATSEVNGTEIAEAAGSATSEETGKATAGTAGSNTSEVNGTMSENATTDVTESATEGVAEVVTGGAAIGAVANVTEKASENANESVTGGATEGATKNSVEIITDAANDVAAANVTEEASENTNKIETEVTTNGATAVAAANANESATDGVAEITTCAAHKVATANVTEEVSENTDTGATTKVKENVGEDTTEPVPENVTETATHHSTESLTETIAEAGDQTKPAESETTALTETMATGKKKSIRKTIGWTIIVLAALTLTALAAFMILAHTAPDFIDSILYTPEELEIINR